MNTFATEYYKCFPPRLNNASTLYTLLNLKFVFFCENSNAGKAKLKKFYLLTFILPGKRYNFLTLTSRYGKFSQKYAPNVIRIGLVL